MTVKLFRACDCYHFPCKHNPKEEPQFNGWKGFVKWIKRVWRYHERKNK